MREKVLDQCPADDATGHAASGAVRWGSIATNTRRSFGVSPLTPIPLAIVAPGVLGPRPERSAPGAEAGCATAVAPIRNRYTPPARVNTVSAAGLDATSAPTPAATTSPARR